MKIISDFTGDYKNGYNTALKIEMFSDDDDVVFFYGIQCGIDKKLLDHHKSYRRKILLDLWSPCAFFVDPNHFSIVDGFDEVYSICPYTSEWTNRQLGRKLMKYCFYHVSPDTINPRNPVSIFSRLLNIFKSDNSHSNSDSSDPASLDKIYDVCYVGGIYSQEHKSMIDIISKYKYVFVTQSRAEKATHRYLSNSDKINLVGQCKIGICFNKLYPTDSQILNIKTYLDWQSNKAFDRLSDAEPICPQIKTRLHELALCKTLILCHRDPWNLVEDYYEPGQDFIYFENVHDLNKIIPEILANWDSYQGIIDNAYRKVSNYFTRNLVKMVQDGRAFSTQRIKGS
jgi:hypothetical protein